MKTNNLALVLIVSIVVNIALALQLLVPQITTFKGRSTTASQNKKTVASAEDQKNVFDEINPASGFAINASPGDIGPNMVASGVIDAEKFKATYAKSGQPLTPEQEEMLLKGTDRKITITRDNSYFLLNFFWAVGLANRSAILEEGDMMKYGGNEGAGNFASTGGWTLSKGNAMNYYSKSVLIPLTDKQEALVREVASNIYRPCCNNSTAFPDCNHGMALLGILELMASQGATEEEMYEAGKYISAYWFPDSYFDLALYFKNKEGTPFRDINAKKLLGKDYSSATGAQNAKKWLIAQGLVQQPPKQGGGCGV